MFKARDLALIGIFIALLIGGQFALSFVAGVEIVTVLILSFAFYFGLKRSLIVVNAYNILRCFLFGFFPSVIILYAVYFNLFVILFSFIGRKFNGKLTVLRLVFTVAVVSLCTACFTLLDDIITPLFYGFNLKTALAYFYASLPTMALQTVNAVVTVSILLPLLIKAYSLIFPDKKEKRVGRKG